MHNTWLFVIVMKIENSFEYNGSSSPLSAFSRTMKVSVMTCFPNIYQKRGHYILGVAVVSTNKEVYGNGEVYCKFCLTKVVNCYQLQK